MNCLVVSAHPIADSLCHQLRQHVETALQQAGHDVTSIDLYKQNFQPALAAERRASYYEADYEHANLVADAEKLQAAQALVLVFPTWWFGFPAILKGWFDQVWGPGIAFDHGDNFGPIVPRLNNLQKVLVVTSLGSPWWVDKLVLRQPVKRVVKYGLLGACAKRSQLDFLSLYNSENTTVGKIEAYKLKITRVLRGWQM